MSDDKLGLLASDPDPQETEEWLEALDAVFENEGVERAHYLVGRLIRRARRKGAYLPYSAVTAWPAPISPASLVSSLKSSLARIRFS